MILYWQICSLAHTLFLFFCFFCILHFAAGGLGQFVGGGNICEGIAGPIAFNDQLIREHNQIIKHKHTTTTSFIFQVWQIMFLFCFFVFVSANFLIPCLIAFVPALLCHLNRFAFSMCAACKNLQIGKKQNKNKHVQVSTIFLICCGETSPPPDSFLSLFSFFFFCPFTWSLRKNQFQS